MGKKRVVHKYRNINSDHLCGDNRYIIPVGMKTRFECCSRYWSKVTCKKCLNKREK